MILIQPSTHLSSVEIDSIRALEFIVKNHDHLEGSIALNSEYNIVSDISLYYLLYLNQQLVSVLSIFMPKLSEAEISGFTHPDYRNQGYFKRLLAAAKKELNRYAPLDLLFVCEYQSMLGLNFIKSLHADYAFSEYSLYYNNFHFAQFDHSHLNLTIRNAKTEDIDPLVDIYQNTFHIPSEESKPMVLKTINSEHKKQIIALLDGIIIGTCAVSYRENETYILGVAIDVPYQNKGYGKSFMIKVIDSLITQQISNIMIEVDSTNLNAYKLYRHIGFEKRSEFQYYRIKLLNLE